MLPVQACDCWVLRQWHIYLFFYETAKLFQRDCTIVRSHQQCVSEPVSLQSRQPLVALLFFRLATLIAMQACLIVVLFSPNGVEHLFMCLFAIYPSMK